ncbi:hypothetical protein PR048_001205 [Dryococelus australis]|uniref:PiggyBac transposable element-derived protein domain-containing protein n=1 Tax=Dryococelus australis TaxID=614101 RepID=A0ABQ9IGQ5_9NEOP|nr:hypothetical protein PR048_001205 [Dryococelus australis]
MTIDETLIPFHGRVGFLIYNRKKPAKYGIKVMGHADAHNSYLFNAYMKNKITIVGTMKKNKPQIPKEFLPNKQRAVPSSLYGFTENYTLLSYAPKKNRAFAILFSMQHTPFTDVSNGKPEIISFCNHTKCGIDTLDQKVRNYYANHRTKRWPVAIFYHSVSMAYSNSYILYGMYQDVTEMNRYDFFKCVALSWSYNYLKQWLTIPNLLDDLRKIILDVTEEVAKVSGQENQQRRPENQPSSLA